MSEFMKADKILTADINRATSYEDLVGLLHNSLERSGIAERNPETGQFVRRDPSQSAAPVIVPDEEKQVTKVEVIGGKEFVFTGSAIEVERRVGEALQIAQAVKASTPTVVASRPERAKTQADREQEAFQKSEIELRFRRGEITTADYIKQSGALDEYLESKGFDVDVAAAKQFEQSWQQATEEFLNNTPEGQSWKGGQKNLEIIGNLIQSHGLTDAEDKVAALRAMATEMRAKGLEFDGDVSPEQVLESTANASPQEILEAWKSAQPDAETANREFIRINGGTGGMFDRG